MDILKKTESMPDLYSKLLFLYQRRFSCYLTNSSSSSFIVFYFLLFSNQLKILDLLFGWLISSTTTFSFYTEVHNSINDTQSYFSFFLLFLLWLFKEIKKNIGQGFVENFRVKKKTALYFLNKYFYSITGLCFIKQQKIFKSWWGSRL